MFSANRTVWAAGLAIALGVGLSLAPGCGGGADYEGPERAAVKGTVNFAGKPLPYGTITFIATEGRRASAMIRDGSYAIPEEQGPNLGKYQVQIVGHAKAPETTEAGEEGEEEETEDESPDLGPQIIPARYNVNTELEVEITSGENTHPFDLKPE